MPPDFNQKTTELLARRASGRCSNPDCRVLTIGPNSNPEKHTTIGEAAHIAGARPESARYDPSMTDTTRAMITNAIWLCRNCHRTVDRDASQFPADILLAWRTEHERYAMKEIGTRTQAIQYDHTKRELSPFSEYPLPIQRIVGDRPDGWEWRLTAELMRHLNAPHFKRLGQFRLGLVSKERPRIEDEEILGWLSDRTETMMRMTPPFVNCMELLNQHWGKPGESGNAQGILDACLLIEENLACIVKHEEEVRFANLPDEAQEIRLYLADAAAYAIQRLEQIPEDLDKILEIALNSEQNGEPVVIEREIVIELPEGWEEKMEGAINRLGHKLRLLDF